MGFQLGHQDRTRGWGASARSPILDAIMSGNMRIAERLLKDKDGNENEIVLALQHAASFGDLGATEFFLTVVDTAFCKKAHNNYGGNMFVSGASTKGYIEILRRLYKKFPDSELFSKNHWLNFTGYRSSGGSFLAIVCDAVREGVLLSQQAKWVGSYRNEIFESNKEAIEKIRKDLFDAETAMKNILYSFSDSFRDIPKIIADYLDDTPGMIAYLSEFNRKIKGM
jgi:hypothetical protein